MIPWCFPGNPDAPAWEIGPGGKRALFRIAERKGSGGALRRTCRCSARAPSSGRALADLGARAVVPEQIPSDVRAVSGRTLRSCEGFAAWTTADSCTRVAFPGAG